MPTTSTATPQHRTGPQSQPAPASAPLAPAPAQDAPTRQEWQEDDYILALAHLERIQDVVSSLRLTIPQLVRSLTRKHESPKDLWADFAKETIGSGTKLASLKKLWEGGQMRDIRSRVDSSIKESGTSLDNVSVEYREGVKEALLEMGRYGWREQEEEKLKDRKRKRGDEDGSGGLVGAEQAEKAVEAFGKRHNGITAMFDKEPWRITVEYKTSDDFDLHFDIASSTKDDRAVYNVSGPRIPDNATKGERKFLQAVQRCLTKTQKPGDLDHTLDTVAAYRDLREARCEVCQRILDGEGLFPAARRSKRAKSDNGEALQWVAAHEGCMGDT